MVKRFASRTLGGLALLGLVTACTPLSPASSVSQESPRPVKPLPAEAFIRATQTPSYQLSPSPAAKSLTANSKLSPSEVAAQLQQADDKAISAANLMQSAQSQEDWTLVINQWKRAIALLPPVAAAGSQKATVQQKRADYQSRLADAQQKARSNPRQLVTGGQPTGGKGVPLIVAPNSPDAAASPSPTTSPSPTASPASPSPSSSPQS